MEMNSDYTNQNQENQQENNNLNEEQDNQLLQNNESNNEKEENNEVNIEKVENNEVNIEKVENNELNNEKVENNELNNEKVENNELNNEKEENNELNIEKVENNELNNEKVENNELNNEKEEKNELNNEKEENNEFNNEKEENNESKEENNDINIEKNENINNQSKIEDLKKELNQNKEKEENKYELYSLIELKNEKEIKDNKLLELYSEKNKAKEYLESIIKKINELYTNHSDYLMDKKPDKLTVKKVKQDFELMKKELQNSRKSNQTIKNQFTIYSNKVNQVLTPEKINTFEEEIDKIKKENLEINEKINKLSSKSIVNSIELRSCTENKKFPKKINNFTEDVKSFESKKHDYYTKLNMNKKSLENLIKENNVLNKLYNNNIKEDSNNNLISKLNFWINLINQDLNGKIEEILERIEKDESKALSEIDKRQFMKKGNKNPLYLPILNEKSNKEKNVKSRNNNINVNKSVNISSRKRQYQGVFNRYSFFKDNNSKLIKSISNVKFMNINDLNNNNLNDILNDYNNTNEDDYRELIGKKEQLVEINSRLESKIKEIYKNTMIKVKNVSRTVNDNTIRLENLKQKNELLTNEIMNLEKVYELSIQQSEIKDRIKNNESNFMILQKKKINDLYYNVDNTNILKELKEEDEINKKINIIKNSITESEKRNKKQKKIYLADSNFDSSKTKFDIQNYDYNYNINKTENTERKRKIQKIKSKYFPIDKNEEKEDIVNTDNFDFNNLDFSNKNITTVEQKEIF